VGERGQEVSEKKEPNNLTGLAWSCLECLVVLLKLGEPSEERKRERNTTMMYYTSISYWVSYQSRHGEGGGAQFWLLPDWT
jgi:hypothetical protein